MRLFIIIISLILVESIQACGHAAWRSLPGDYEQDAIMKRSVAPRVCPPWRGCPGGCDIMADPVDEFCSRCICSPGRKNRGVKNQYLKMKTFD